MEAPHCADKLEHLRERLQGLSRLLGGGEGTAQPTVALSLPQAMRQPARSSSPKPALKQPSAAVPARSPARSTGAVRRAAAPQSPPFKSVIAPSKSVLRATNASPAVGPAYAAFKEEEAKLLAQKGELQLLLNKERKKRTQVEAELKRAQEMQQYRVGEDKHLKAALRQRDEAIVELTDRVRELELAVNGDRVASEAVAAAEAERDELRGAVQEMVGRLAHTNEIVTHAEQTVAAMEAKVQSMDAERQAALQQAAAADARAAGLKQAVRDMEWKASMLQQLADLTLHQNEEKMAALRQLLQSESLLDGGCDGEEDEGSAVAAAVAAAAADDLGELGLALDSSSDSKAES